MQQYHRERVIWIRKRRARRMCLSTIHVVANVNWGRLNLKMLRSIHDFLEELLCMSKRYFCKHYHSTLESFIPTFDFVVVVVHPVHLVSFLVIDCAIQWRWFNGNMMWISKWHRMWYAHNVEHIISLYNILICSVFAFQGSNQKNLCWCVCTSVHVFIIDKNSKKSNIKVWCGNKCNDMCKCLSLSVSAVDSSTHLKHIKQICH